MELLGQGISIIAMLAIILSFQCKSNKKLTIVMGIGALLFATSYFFLGQIYTALFNIISFACSLICMKEKLKNRFVFGVLVALYIFATWITYSDWWSIILMAGQITGSYSIMFGSGKFIRNTRFFVVSPMWIINNTVMCFSIGGLICEIITMISVIVSFIRYRKTGFEK